MFSWVNLNGTEILEITASSP